MLRLATRGDLEALIETERPDVPPAEAFAVLNHLALRTTGLPLRDLIRRPEVTKKAQTVQKKIGRST
jgi:hypothetical protein